MTDDTQQNVQDDQQNGAPTPATAAAQSAKTSRQADQFSPPGSQEELDRIIGERLARERAKYTDYDDLKAKAEKFDEAEAANKSEAERLADELAKATERNQTLESDAVRAQVAATHGVPLEIITGTTKEQCEEQAETFKKYTSQQQSSGWGSHIGTGDGGGTTADPIRQLIESKRS